MSSSGQTFATQQPQIQTFSAASCILQNQSFTTPQVVPSQNVPIVASSSNPKDTDKNLALATRLVNCYNALVAGELPPQLLFAALDQIHPEDMEEMDITWQIAMAVFRAKQFAKKTGKNNSGMNGDKKVGFNKGMLRYFNCHESGHFAHECPKPNRRVNNNRTMVAAGNNRAGATANGPENALLAQIDDTSLKTDDADPKEKLMEMQFAFMASTSSDPRKSEVTLLSFSYACKEYVKVLCDEIQSLRREVDDLKYEGYQLRKGKKPLKVQLEAKIKDFRRIQAEYSDKCELYNYVKRQNDALTAELDTLKKRFDSVNFAFQNFDGSSKVVATMIDHCMDFKRNQQKGLGYDHVPPPYNHTYQYQPLSIDEIAKESFMVYGKSSGFVSGGIINVKSTNASTSTADQPLDQAKHEAGESVSVFKSDVSVMNNFNCVSDVETENISYAGSSSDTGQLRRNVVRPWYVDGGCSQHMTGDISQLSEIQSFNGGYISFAGGDGGKITQHGTVTNEVLSFENVNYALDLKHI
ncbi:uncharacterized protein LOC128127934 [Lactuca sativa]|uniref:uncharacterized protein LOC128127934 n=1 Tax=Lactuca sativa TaxID=4236 RepID=UPI0022B00739|nr:uncharacterized protein LOC128127934 [Lactuca sativa]